MKNCAQHCRDAGQVGGSDHAVLAALRERKASGSKPGARQDKMKIALAIEGAIPMLMLPC